MELATVMTEIMRLGSEFNARRLEAFILKRGGDEHSAFLHKVKMCLDNADFKSMTRNELTVHLFLRDAEATMAKMATEFLQLDPKDQSMADLRTTLRQTENSPWYGAQKHGAKYMGSGDAQAGQRWCAACSSSTNIKVSAGGFVSIVKDVATRKKNAERILKI